MNTKISITKLKKSFGKLDVLKGINLDLSVGSIHALLGPNGSGKSTLIKCLLGMVIPESGEILIDGKKVNGSWEYRKSIGYMPQIAHFPENMRVRELISMIKNIRNQPSLEEKFIRLLRLEDALNKALKTLSGGTRQKVNALLALMFDSPILIFDEATVGLDPVTRLHFKQHLLKEKEAGKTIILVSHFINEVEELADEIVFILEGRIFFQGSLFELKSQTKEENLEKVIAEILEKNGQEKLEYV